MRTCVKQCKTGHQKWHKTCPNRYVTDEELEERYRVPRPVGTCVPNGSKIDPKGVQNRPKKGPNRSQNGSEMVPNGVRFRACPGVHLMCAYVIWCQDTEEWYAHMIRYLIASSWEGLKMSVVNTVAHEMCESRCFWRCANWIRVDHISCPESILPSRPPKRALKEGVKVLILVPKRVLKHTLLECYLEVL